MMSGKLSLMLKTGLVLALCAATAVTAACGSAPREPVAAVPAEQKAERPEAQEQKICLADDGLSNLQLSRPDVPVYDRYTVAERQAKGLPTAYAHLQTANEWGKTAYLTFDDGPDDLNTPAILDVLKEQGVPGTFYVQGAYAELHPDIIRRIFQEHHALGNHSYNHDYNELYPQVESFMAQLAHTDEVLQKIIGVRPLIIRAPGGAMGQFDERYEAAVQELGYVEHDWNVSSADTAPNNPTAQDFIDNITFGAQRGLQTVIVLMHSSAGHEETVKALPGIISALRAQGYGFGVITPLTPQPW